MSFCSSHGGFSTTSQIGTLFFEGTKKTSHFPGGKRCGCFFGVSAFERYIYTEQPVHAWRRAEDMKALQRDTEGFAEFSFLPSASRA